MEDFTVTLVSKEAVHACRVCKLQTDFDPKFFDISFNFFFIKEDYGLAILLFYIANI